MQIVHKTNDFFYAIFFKTKQGTMGIDPNKKDYIISNIDGKRFSEKQLLCFLGVVNARESAAPWVRFWKRI